MSQGIPAFDHIEPAFRRYLEYGILANGFARAHCAAYGRDFSSGIILAWTRPLLAVRRVGAVQYRLCQRFKDENVQLTGVPHPRTLGVVQ